MIWLPSGNLLHSYVKWRFSSLIYPSKMAVFHSCVTVYQRVLYITVPSGNETLHLNIAHSKGRCPFKCPHDGRGVTHVVYCMFPHGDGKQVWKLCWCGEAPQKFTGPVQARNPLKISWNYPNTRTLLANRQSGIVGSSWRLFNHFCPINLRSSGNQCPSQLQVLQCGAP